MRITLIVTFLHKQFNHFSSIRKVCIAIQILLHEFCIAIQIKGKKGENNSSDFFYTRSILDSVRADYIEGEGINLGSKVIGQRDPFHPKKKKKRATEK